MIDFFSNLLDANFMPHGHCFFWRPEIVWLHVIADALTAVSYFLIPFALLRLARKRKDLAFHWMFVLFGVFILACGTAHLMAIWTLWIPMYRLEGIIKGVTALASVPTSLLLIRFLPQLIALPSPAQLRSVNLALEQEVRERKVAEERVRLMNEVLESRVAQRTSELEKANQALRIANRDLEQFAFSASHDLKEPLRNVAIYSQLLQKRYSSSLDDEGDTFLGYITEGSQRMSQMISDLLEYTRVNDPEPEQRSKGLVDANVVLDTVLGDLRQAVSERGATVTSDRLPELSISEVSLQRILHNLIENAIKYSKDNVPPSIHVSSERRNGFWQFAIRDNGIGIAREYQDQVFGIFKRLHTHDSKYSGTGIGLSICQRAIGREGGNLWVESELGQGSTFYFTLPIPSEKR